MPDLAEERRRLAISHSGDADQWLVEAFAEGLDGRSGFVEARDGRFREGIDDCCPFCV
ncbi:hypothetical protein TIFTF001_019595 [Ficus carica]|uniref:Uncharacterized protein n=1 Tax=Ficus carica TaxID=3494 RepID=A0AA88ADR9_FICCA|nr:hypothetical protein TIFTF001_019595 [Ficus carica]